MINTLQPAGVLTDGTVIDALTMLQRVADRDIGDDLLDWMCKRQPSGDVLSVALRTLTSCSIELADRIFAKPEYLRYFSAPSARRPSGQSLTRLLLGTPLATETASDTPFTPSELFFRELLRADPLRNAERLVDQRETVDVSRPLAALCDITFMPQDDTLVRFALRRLAGSDATQGLLTKTLRAIPDFQRRMRPHLEPLLERLAPTERADAIARFRASMDAAIPAPRAQLPEPSVFGNLFKNVPLPGTPGYLGLDRLLLTPKPPDPRVRVNSRGTGVNTLQMAFGVSLLLLAVFGFNGDIATGAALGTRLASRGLSLLAALVVWGVLGYLYLHSMKEFNQRMAGYKATAIGATTSATDAVWQTVPLLALFGAYAVFEAHKQYVGPVHFWNQAAVFAINSAGILLIARVFEVE